MRVFCAAVFLLLCQCIENSKTDDITTTEDVADILNRTNDKYKRPVDFRCYRGSLYKFDNFEGLDYAKIGYAPEITPKDDRIGCAYFEKQVIYPRLTGTDPMMVIFCCGTTGNHSFYETTSDCNIPFYIKTMVIGFASTAKVHVLRRETPLLRIKEYCASWPLVAPAFLDYWERFHSDGDTCMKMVEFIKRCSIFRQIRELYTAKQLEKLCLDEDGCYNVMDFYDADLPYCVKTTAINEFKNSSVGSWHNSVINYCRLTAMVPGIKEAKYDMSILTQKGRIKEKLRDMCLYLRYRVLPEEGKEKPIPDTSDYEYETFEDEQTTQVYETGGSNLILSVYWNIVYFFIIITAKNNSNMT